MKDFQQLQHKSIEGQFALLPPCDSPGGSPNCGPLLTHQLVWLEETLMFFLSAESTLMTYIWKIPEVISELPHCLLIEVLAEVIKRAPKQLGKAYFSKVMVCCIALGSDRIFCTSNPFIFIFPLKKKRSSR